MKFFLCISLLCLGILFPGHGFSQTDTLVVRDSAEVADSLPPLKLKLFSTGVQFSNLGTIQYFDGYSREILYLNAQSGLPLYNDWAGYSNFTIFPEFFTITGQANFVDSARGMRVRAGASFIHRNEIMVYRSGFSINDTTFGRDGGETSNLIGLTGAVAKQTRTFLKAFRAYAGIELEADVASSSKIYLLEFSYDYGDAKFVEINEFQAKGRPRMNFFGGALIGLESRFLKHFGLFAEVRSGFGFHWIFQEKPIGISRVNIGGGLCYYFGNTPLN